MTPLLPNLRYEKKFVVEGFTLPEVLVRVKRHPCAFHEVYPPRIVNNLYLDSASRRDYHDHVNGTANRSKTRVRWYGPQTRTAQQPRLERKLKRGTASGKEAHPLPPFSINGDRLRLLLETAFDSAVLPPMLRSTLRLAEPALFNRYQRHYYLSHDRQFRLTVDSELQFAGVAQDDQPTFASSLPVTTLILELKFGAEAAEGAAAVTNAFPLRVARFSKYVAGIERI